VAKLLTIPNLHGPVPPSITFAFADSHTVKTNSKLLLGVTTSVSVPFFRGQARRLKAAGFDVMVVSAPGKELAALASQEGVNAVAIPMRRQISPLADCLSLFRLLVLIRRLRPAIADFGTPKAGLLGMIASRLAGVPCRIYTLRGLRLETVQGLKRGLLLCSEWIACRCATRVRCVGPSLRDKSIALGIVRREKTVVLGYGTSNGIDAGQFASAPETATATARRRSMLGMPANAPIVGFVGRLTRDKGIVELLQAFELLKAKIPGVCLLLVGDFEQGDPVSALDRQHIEQDPNIFHPGFVSDTGPYYHLMDVLALPTYREGFPGVPLEAGAAGKPVVTTNATGAVDSVIDGETGFVVPVGDALSLASALAAILSDPVVADRMGKAGQERVLRNFSRELVMDATVEQYRELLQSHSGRQCGWQLGLKRLLDITVSFVGLLVLMPVFLLVAGLVLLTMGGPVLFRQQRPGKLQAPFTVLKFRTMGCQTDAAGRLLPDDERLTALGRLLRATSLDELPQLWNVLRGELSLVGPRPLLMQYLSRYTPDQMRRHEVLPGITGWAQINGRNALSWEQKFQHDIWYVDHWSLGLDLQILARTLWQVIRRDGIAQAGHATMPEFTRDQRTTPTTTLN
jgi:lipopolysaccharide/colanic/teichoic acid biosynthesis glycosyltransferase